MINYEQDEMFIYNCMETYYDRLYNSIMNLTIDKIMNKNDFLSASQNDDESIHLNVLSFVSSSKETHFAKQVFEPMIPYLMPSYRIALNDGKPIQGIDFINDEFKNVLSLKSSNRSFNGPSKREQIKNFIKYKENSDYTCIVGFCTTSQKNPTIEKQYLEFQYLEFHGKKLWEYLTSDVDYYNFMLNAIRKHKIHTNHPEKLKNIQNAKIQELIE